LGHLEEALVEYAAAVARAPHDEGALLGQAEALTIAGQRVDAALALDHVAEIQEAAGRLPEAADTLRRAMELEDGTERARHQRGLLREIRLSAGDQAAEQLLARALRLRDEPPGAVADGTRSGAAAPIGGGYRAVPETAPEYLAEALERSPEIQPIDSNEVAGIAEVAEVAGIGETVAPVAPSTRPVEPAWPVNDFLASAGRSGLHSVPSAGDTESYSRGQENGATKIGERPDEVGSAVARDAAPAAPAVQVEMVEARAPHQAGPADVATSANVATSPSRTELPASIEPILAAVGVMDSTFDAEVPLGPVGESQQQPTGDELLVAAEAADLAGDSATLRSLLLWTARAYAREGRFDAGLDATHRLLQKAPGDVDAHLVLVELYVARDWNNLAAEKLALLGRLAELNNDEATRQRLCKVANRVFPKDERLGALCA
jgi:tetratricopeptide (TPR) repeat protein